VYPTRLLPSMAVLQSQPEMTAEAVRPVLTLRFEVKNISVFVLSSPTVRFRTQETMAMPKAITKPMTWK